MNEPGHNSSTQRNQKFKYLTTNMQNLLKNFNENLSSGRQESRLELLNRIKQHQMAVQAGRSLVRSKTMTNSRAERPLSQLEPFQEKAKINRSQSQLNYNSLHRAACSFDYAQNNEEKIRKSKSSQQIQMNSSYLSDSYNSDSELSSRSNSPKKSDSKRRCSTITIDNPKSVVLRREKTLNETDLPLMKQKLLASIKRGQSVAPVARDESSIKRTSDLENRIAMLESELIRERKKLNVEREEKYELVNEIKMRYENEKAAALKALEAKLNTNKLFELNKLRESLETQTRDDIEKNKKYFENELASFKVKLHEKNERCFQLEKLLREEHLKSERLFLKSIELVRKFGQKSTRESLCSTEIQNEYSTDLLSQKLVTIRQILIEQDESQDQIKNLSTIDDLVQDIEIKCKRLQQQNQTHLLDLQILKETKLKLESLYKIKCKSDLNKSARIHKLEINYQSELLKLRNEFNSDLVRYLEHKLVLKDTMLNDLVLRLSKILNILNISEEPSETIRQNLTILVQNLANSLNLNDPSLQSVSEVNGNFNLDSTYKKAPVNLVAHGVEINPDCIIRKIEGDIKMEKDKPDRTIQDELLELDKHLNNIKQLSNSLSEQTLNKGSLKPVQTNSKSSSNCSSCDISNSSHSFIELEEASEIKFGEKPNINLVAHKTYKKKSNYELIVQ